MGLYTVSGDSKDPNLPPGYSGTEDSDPALRGSANRGHQRGLWGQSRPFRCECLHSRTAHGHKHGLLVLKQTRNMNLDPGCRKITDPEMTLRSSVNPDTTMASDGSVDLPHQYGPPRQLRTVTSKWVQAAAHDHQHRPQPR